MVSKWLLIFGLSFSLASEAHETMLPEFDKLWDYSQPAATEEKFSGLLPISEAAGDRSYQIELLTQIARAQGLQERFEEGHVTLDRAEAMLNEETKRPRARLLLERGRLFNSAGELAKAQPLFEQAWKAAEEAKAPRFAIDAVHMLAISARLPEEQIRWNLKGIEMAAAEPAQTGWLSALYNNLGEACAAAGDFQGGLDAFRKLAELERLKGSPEDIYNLKDQSRMLRQLGRLDEAIAIIRPLWRRLAEEKRADGWISGEYAECLAAAGKSEKAAPIALEALKILEKDPWVVRNDAATLKRLKKIANRP